MYLTLEEYKELSSVIKDDKDIEKMLNKASRYIDILTYNRINKVGFGNCSKFEIEIIKECTQEITDFLFINKDFLDNIINSYSLNGVNITFGNDNNNLITINGITILKTTYNKLNLTRFTSLIL